MLRIIVILVTAVLLHQNAHADVTCTTEFEGTRQERKVCRDTVTSRVVAECYWTHGKALGMQGKGEYVCERDRKVFRRCHVNYPGTRHEEFKCEDTTY